MIEHRLRRTLVRSELYSTMALNYGPAAKKSAAHTLSQLLKDIHQYKSPP